MEKTRFRLAVVGVINSGNDILVVQKKVVPGKSLAGHWMFPGGYLRSGESPEVALKSILKHDLNLDVMIGEAIGLGANRRRREGKIEFISTLWLQAALARDFMEPVKKWQAIKWVCRHKVVQELSESVRAWMPVEVQIYLIG